MAHLLDHGATRAPCPTQVIGCAGAVLELEAAIAFPSGSAVRIDVEGGIVLGEVIRTEAGKASCSILIQIDQIIPSVSDLARLVRHVMGQDIAASSRAIAAAP